jgi:hypothetical protein
LLLLKKVLQLAYDILKASGGNKRTMTLVAPAVGLLVKKDLAAMKITFFQLSVSILSLAFSFSELLSELY